ncbi:unnamed protein product [Kuraishia capsulata CBS 1993]|uniref:PRA1 family protein n=1 Tax=Kuraishia capsulata CBS 1993 TaxID=1382522 RepID=W6MH98_9ASCO|nr:uncharacterized protein KUCA_T00000965001 [Kuraishia capsulata CBS 1993]CDK24998.1 unnamed protein product [Kuraishia capsulata CBS 1993]
MLAQISNLQSQSDVVTLQSKLSSIRPPQEFFDVRRFSKPANFSEIQQRVTYNLGYFQANYAAIVALLSVYSLLTNLLLLFVIIFTVFGVFGINKLDGRDLELPMGRLTTSQLYTGLLVVAIPLGFLASPISTMMWLIGASSVTVLSHASFIEKPIETVFEETV